MSAVEQVVRLAEVAGEVLMPYFGRLRSADATVKGGRRRDLVSRADVDAEEAILAQIPGADAVLAEESGQRAGTSGRSWCVDPLDGTINFLHGIPFWCVSIALFEGDWAAAAVHAPALGMTFSAERGRGALLNGAACRVSTTAEIGDAIVATGFPYARDTVADNNLDNIPRVGVAAGGLRRFGSAALDLAFVAAGHLDGFWELHLNPWDLAAGALLVNEAGGQVTDFAGRPDHDRILHGRNLIATNGPIHEQLRGLLAPLREL